MDGGAQRRGGRRDQRAHFNERTPAGPTGTGAQAIENDRLVENAQKFRARQEPYTTEPAGAAGDGDQVSWRRPAFVSRAGIRGDGTSRGLRRAMEASRMGPRP